MLIPAPDLMGTTTSTPAVWEFTTSALAPVLHHDRLGKQISSVSDPMSSLGVCQDMMQTTITMVPPLLSSSLPLTSISHLESVVIAPQSECSPEPSSEFGSSPTLPLSMSSFQPPQRLPWQIRSSAQSKLQDHRVPPFRSTSPLLTAMATPSRTRASAMEGFRQTNHFRHALQQTTRFLQTVPHVEMKMRPKTRVLAFRLSKHSSHFSSSPVGASLHFYFRTAALVKNVLINVVTKSRLTSCSQPCTDSRVVPLLDRPSDAMEELSPKANAIQIAHPLHPPKAPDKARHCQVPILYSPLNKAQLHLEFIPHYMTFAMIVFNSYGSRRNILVHKVFDKRQKRGIAQKYVPDLLLVPHHLRKIGKSVPDFLLVEFGEPIEYSTYLDTISQPPKIPRKLKSSRQYREYMGNLLAYLIYFFQRTEPLQDLKRIFLKVATALEEQWVDGLSRQLSLNFFGTQLRDGSISAYFASKQLPGVLTSRCLRNNHPHQIVVRLPNRQLAIPCVQMGVIELVVKSLIQSYSGVMSRI
ncbi:hypothetical protein ACFX10_003207 [Malus domestica]